jgi:hypothetical protein
MSDDNDVSPRPPLVRASSTPVVDPSTLPAPTNACEAAVYNLVRLTIGRARTVRADAIADALKALKAVVPPSRDANRATIRQYVHRIETHVLGTLSDAVGQGGVLTCAALMHEHAVWTGSTLTTENVRRCIDALRAYCAVVADATHSMKPIAAAFLSFLTTHALDVENTLLGLRASDRALKELLSAEAMAELMAKRELEDDLSRHRLLELVGSWSAMPRAQVLAAATSLSARVAQMWQAGDLLVVFMERGRYVFARFTGKRIGNQLVVHASPAELDSVSVDLQQCFPIAEGIRSQLASGRSALSLTVTPINDFVQECGAAMTAGLDELLTREGAVVELAHRTMRDEAVDMSDYYALRHNMAVLGGSHSSTVVRAWFAAQRAHLIERSIAFCKQLDVAQLPAPTRIRQLRDFARYPLDQLDSTQSLIGRFERAHGDALMQLVKRRDALLRGDVKNQLTSWWLGVIRERVSAFLAQVGYVDVLGHNFLDLAHPPADMGAVKANKRLLDECLDLDTDKHGFKAVLKELSEKIYPAIERFIKEACCTLVLLAGLPAPVWPESVPSTDAAIEAGLNLSIAAASGACSLCGRSSNAASDASMRDEVQGLARDVQYLVTMKEIERSGDGNRDVTSIRGLAIGRVVRTWQDLRTAIEVHDPPTAAAAQSDAARDALYASASSVNSATDSAAKLVTTSSGRKTQSSGNRFFGSMKGSLKSMLGIASSSDDVPTPLTPATEPYSATATASSNRSADDNDIGDDDSLSVLARLARSRADTESLSAELNSVSLDVQKKLSFRRDVSDQFDKFFGAGDMLADEADLFESVADDSLVARSESPPPPAPDE